MEQTLKCDSPGCGFVAKGWSGMASHRFMLHNLKGPIPGYERKARTVAVKPAGPFICDVKGCGREFENKHKLGAHRFHSHGPSGTLKLKTRKPWGSNRLQNTTTAKLAQELENVRTIINLYEQLPTHAREYVDNKLETL